MLRRRRLKLLRAQTSSPELSFKTINPEQNKITKLDTIVNEHKDSLIEGAAVGDRDSRARAPAAAPAIDTDF